MLKNREQVLKDFEEIGISVAGWSRENGYNLRTVYAVLYGELKCKRGISHEIAVKLGLKASPTQSKMTEKDAEEVREALAVLAATSRENVKRRSR